MSLSKMAQKNCWTLWVWKMREYISRYFFLADIEEEQMSSRKIYPGQKSPGQLWPVESPNPWTQVVFQLISRNVTTKNLARIFVAMSLSWPSIANYSQKIIRWEWRVSDWVMETARILFVYFFPFCTLWMSII